MRMLNHIIILIIYLPFCTFNYFKTVLNNRKIISILYFHLCLKIHQNIEIQRDTMMKIKTIKETL